MEIEIQQLHAKVQAKELSLLEQENAYKKLKEQTQKKNRLSESQITDQGQSILKMQSELGEKSKQLQELTTANADLQK